MSTDVSTDKGSEPDVGSTTLSVEQSAVRGQSTSVNPDKLDLMAENSSLKVKLAKAEKNLKDSEDRLNSAQRQINELQARLNDRTIELTELRSRSAAGSMSTSSYNQTHLEVEKLKCAVESLLLTSEEKDRRISELQSLLKKYTKLEALITGQSHSAQILEQLGLDGETVNTTASLPRKSPAHYAQGDRAWQNIDDIDGQIIHDPLKPSMPHPSATSTPVNLHTVGGSTSDVLAGGSMRRNIASTQGSGKSPSASTSPPSTIALTPSSPDRHSGSLSYDEASANITQINTLPSAKVRNADAFGTLPKDVYLNYSVPNRSSRHKTQPTKPQGTGYSASNAPESAAVFRSPSYDPGAQAHMTSPNTPIQTGTASRRRGLLTSFGKGFVTLMGTGLSSTSAPNLGDGWLVFWSATA